VSKELATREPSGRDLGARAARGASVVLGGQSARLLLQIAGIVLLARLLNPSDYGVLAMVTAIIGVAEVLRDFGLAPAAIQAPTLSSQERSNLFWLNGLIGLLLSGLVAAAALPIAYLYGDASLAMVVIALAPVYLLNGFSTQLRAHLSREFRFGALVGAELLGQAAGLAVGLAMAFLGYGYWALVAMQLTQAFVILIAIASVGRWVPGAYRRSTPIGHFVRYGSSLLATQLVIYASANVDSILIGLRYGASQLGQYNRAFQMLILPLNQLTSPATRVALPVLSRLQHDPARFSRYMARGQLCLAWLVLPVFTFTAANAAPVVDLVLGPGWNGVVPLFQILAVGGCFQALSYTTQWAFLAMGRTNSNLKFAAITRSGMIILIITGSFIGPLGVAAAYSVSVALIWIAGLWWINLFLAVPSAVLIAQGLRTLGVMSAIAGSMLLLHTVVVIDSDWLELIASAVVAGVVFALALTIPAIRRDVAAVLGVVKTVVDRRRRVAPGAPEHEGMESSE